MPSFTTQVANLLLDGPVVEIQLTISKTLLEKLRSENKPIPNPIPVRGLIDTGATFSVIQVGLAQKLGLNPIGTAIAQTPSTSTDGVQAYKFNLALFFPNQVTVEVNAVEMPLEGQNIQCLVGRDILSLGVLVYTGYINQFTFTL
jgi:predicted aspartyl protease